MHGATPPLAWLIGTLSLPLDGWATGSQERPRRCDRDAAGLECSERLRDVVRSCRAVVPDDPRRHACLEDGHGSYGSGRCLQDCVVICGNAVRSMVPRAALLGSIGGAGIALIGVLPLLKIFADPIPGLLALTVLLVTLVGKRRLPWGLPGALVSALVGIAAFYLLRWAHLTSPLLATSSSQMAALHLSFPWPSLAFLGGLSTAWGYLPIALPFALSTVVGGIDNTESAAAAGERIRHARHSSHEGFCTLAAGLCGGVVESTPYIGHPASSAWVRAPDMRFSRASL